MNNPPDEKHLIANSPLIRQKYTRSVHAYIVCLFIECMPEKDSTLIKGVNLALSAGSIEPETRRECNIRHNARYENACTYATSPSKVSTSLQPKGGTNPIIERPTTLSSISPSSASPATPFPCAHLMQLPRRVSPTHLEIVNPRIHPSATRVRLNIGDVTSRHYDRSRSRLRNAVRLEKAGSKPALSFSLSFSLSLSPAASISRPFSLFFPACPHRALFLSRTSDNKRRPKYVPAKPP